MGTFLKFVLHLMANILWQRIGGKGATPPVRLPKGKKLVDIPVVSPWQTVMVMWAARKVWSSFGGKFKDILAASPHGPAQQLGSWLPNPPAKAKPSKPAAPKAAVPAPIAPAPRAPQTWAGMAQPAAPAPPSHAVPHVAAPATPSVTPKPTPRPAPNYATRQFNDQDDAPAATPTSPAAPVATVPDAPAPDAPPTPPVAAGSKLRPGSLLSSLRRRS